MLLYCSLFNCIQNSCFLFFHRLLSFPSTNNFVFSYSCLSIVPISHPRFLGNLQMNTEYFLKKSSFCDAIIKQYVGSTIALSSQNGTNGCMKIVLNEVWLIQQQLFSFREIVNKSGYRLDDSIHMNILLMNSSFYKNRDTSLNDISGSNSRFLSIIHIKCLQIQMIESSNTSVTKITIEKSSTKNIRHWIITNYV